MSFVLFKRHVAGGKRLEAAAWALGTFYAFVAFHIKCSKASHDLRPPSLALGLVPLTPPNSHHHPGWLPPAAQAFMHSSMRKRTGQLLQVLNRAKPDVEKEKKTASGRAFVRKV